MSEEIKLAEGAPMSAYQDYVTRLEELHGWLEVDLVHNCFLMGEEVGELFKAIRKHLRYYEEHDPVEEERSKLHVGEEIVDVLNFKSASSTPAARDEPLATAELTEQPSPTSMLPSSHSSKPGSSGCRSVRKTPSPQRAS